MHLLAPRAGMEIQLLAPRADPRRVGNAIVNRSHGTLPLAEGELEGVPHDPCQSGREPPSIPPPRGGKDELLYALKRLIFEGVKRRKSITIATRSRLEWIRGPAEFKEDLNDRDRGRDTWRF